MSRVSPENDTREPKSKWRPSSSGTLNEEWETPKRRPRSSWARNEARSEVPRSRESSFDHSKRAHSHPRKESTSLRAESISHRESFDGYSVGPPPPPPWPLKRELTPPAPQPMKPYNRKALQEIAIKIAGHLANRLPPQSVSPPVVETTPPKTTPPSGDNQKLRKLLSKKLFEKHLDEAYLTQQERKLSTDLSEDQKTTPSSAGSSEAGQRREDYSISPVLSLALSKKEPTTLSDHDTRELSESDKEEADRSCKRLFVGASTESLRSPILEDFDGKIHSASQRHYFVVSALKQNVFFVGLCFLLLEIFRLALR